MFALKNVYTTCLHMDRKAHVVFNFNCLIKLKDFIMLAGIHVYTANVVISRKRCKIET